MFVIIGTSAIFLIFVSMTLISEKKNKMIEYLRTMGLLVCSILLTDGQESANLVAYITVYGALSLVLSFLYELSGRLFGIQLVSKTPFLVRALLFPH